MAASSLLWLSWALPDMMKKKRLPCSGHALQALTRIINNRHTLYLQVSFGRSATGGEALQSRSRRVHAHRRMADNNPPDPH
eukprot:151763-Pelagomonas_calceolata.AAC.1